MQQMTFCCYYYYYYYYITIIISSNSSEMIRFGISCYLSARRPLHMKCQALFSLKNECCVLQV